MKGLMGIGKLEIAVQDVQNLSRDDYALARKNSFGASDSSILLDVNLYTTIDQLIKQKRTKRITAEERAVGEKPIVKKGYDLEGVILDKAQKELGIPIQKPIDMYRFIEHPQLTVNYDGICIEDSKYIPVEAKLVSKWGEKYYRKYLTIDDNKAVNITPSGSIKEHIERVSKEYGIPPYYYTQLQQEIMGLDAPYGYLAVLFDDSWTFKLFYIKSDPHVQLWLIKKSEDLYQKIKE